MPASTGHRPFRSGGMVETVVGVVILTVLHRAGLAVPGDIRFFDVFLLGGAALVLWAAAHRPGYGWWLSGLRIAFAGAAIYLSGWGPVLAVAFVLIASFLIDELRRSWPILLTMIVATIAGGQALIALGLVGSYLPAAESQVAGLLGGSSAAMAIVLFGRAEVARAAAERARAAGEERFRTVLQDSEDVTVITDRDGTPFFVSSAVEHVMGLTEQEYGARPAELVHPEDQPAGAAMRDALLDGAREYRLEIRLRHGDGRWRWHEVSARNLLDNPAVGGLVFTHRDVTARRQHEESLRYEATHDRLTGLANKATLGDRLTAWCAGDTGSPLGAVLFLDLDGFKQVNDRFGHAAGDDLLVLVGHVLRECVLGRDLVARLGGDEFAVLLTEVGNEHDAETVAERILDRLAAASPVAGGSGTVRASVGIATLRPGITDPAEALRRADAAMYEAKRAGTHRWKRCRESLAPAR
jgi:diguanylate cyclase (GGDEF)-like protein/PAS domain S-box-containing protein